MVQLRTLPVNVRVFVSPGAFMRHRGELYVNLNSQINAVRDPCHYFTVEVIRQELEVLVNIETLPKHFLPPEIGNKALIDAYFHPITLEGFRLVDTC